MRLKEGYPIKCGSLSAIGLSIVNTVADRHRNTAYHNQSTSMTLNDHEPPE